MTPADAIIIATLAFPATVLALLTLKILRVIVVRINARIRAWRKPTWRVDWENVATGVDVLGDGGRRLD